MPPEVNALLTAVRSESGPENYDDDADAGAALWSGAVNVYFQEKRDKRVQGQAGDVIVWRTLYVDAGRPRVDWRPDLTVDFTYRGKTLTGTVRAVVAPELPGVGGEVQLTLTVK